VTVDETMGAFRAQLRHLAIQVCPGPVRRWLEDVERRAFSAGVAEGSAITRQDLADAIEPELAFLESQGRGRSVKRIREALR
jgi:hypothetical protein